MANSDAMHVELTAAEGGLVIEALAELPFKTVYALIGEINRQANLHDHGDETQACVFSRPDLTLIVKALGALPYSRVHGLVANLHSQMAQATEKG